MHRYALSQRLLHWLIALMVLGVLAVGMIFAILEFDGTLATFGKDTTNALYKYHKTFGVIILAAMIVRIAVKLACGKPDYAVPLTRFEHVASNAVHGLLYLLLILQPVVGWLATGASGYPVEFFGWTLPPILGKDKETGEFLYGLHGVFGWMLLILVGLHIAAALKHTFVNRDGLLWRMF